MGQQCGEPRLSRDPKRTWATSLVYVESKRKPTYTDWMKHRVDSDYGKQIYSHRMSVVGPVFGNIDTNKGLRRFSLRGKEKVQGQRKLFCMVHNIEELANYGKMSE